MTASNREDLEAQLLELLYGELTDAQVKALDAQLADAPDLRAQLDQWHEVRRITGELPLAEPDPQVRYDLLRAARVAATQPERARWWAWVQRLSTAPAMAGLALAVIAGSLLFTVTSDFSDPAMSGADESPAEGLSATKSNEIAPAAASPRPVTLGFDKPSAPQLEPSPAPPVSTATDGVDDLFVAPPKSPSTPTKKRTTSRRSPEEKDLAPRKLKGKSARIARKGKRSRPRTKKSKSSSRAPRTQYEFGTGGGTSGARAPAPAVQAPASVPRSGAKSESARGRFAPPPPASAGDDGLLDAEADEKPKTRTPGQAPTSAAAKALDVYDDPPPTIAPGSVPEPEPAQTPQAAPEPRWEPQPTDDVAPAPAPETRDSASSFERRVKPNRRADRADRGQPAADAPVAESPASSPPRSAGVEALAAALTRARAARRRGAHRVAVREYETYLRGSSGQRNVDAIWFEAAESYEALGDLGRARQLFRLVARAGGARAAEARIRLNKIAPRPPSRDIGGPARNNSSVPTTGF